MLFIHAYILQAVYDWIHDGGQTAYVLVNAKCPQVSVPKSYIKSGKITLNCSKKATEHFHISNQAIQFNARFGSQVSSIYVPIESILALYSRESQAGIIFESGDILLVGMEKAYKPKVSEVTAGQKKSAHLRILDEED